MLLDECDVPVVLAPLSGGPSTPELAAAVNAAGGLGFLAAGYLSADDLAARVQRTRELTARPFGVNLFVPGAPADRDAVAAYARRLRPKAEAAGVALGEARHDDDGWEAKLDLLTRSPVGAVSFTFGCPPADVVTWLREVGSEVWVTVTAPEDAKAAEAAGADVLVVQGTEAGGHRGGFTDDRPPQGLLALLQLVSASTSLPLVATGGIMTGPALAAVLAAGASAGAMGTAFLGCPEAGTAAVHRTALEGERTTELTRAFTGRTARGLRNRFLDEHSAAAPAAYPAVHHLTAPLRAHARAEGDPETVNLWAGQAYPLATGLPAGEVVRTVAEAARQSLDRARSLL